MLKHPCLILACLLAATGPAAAQGILWDNGDTDGVNGVSNISREGGWSQNRRTVLDDFEIPTESFGQLHWEISALQWVHIWNQQPPGSGQGAEVFFREDDNGRPGDVVATAQISRYEEVATGRRWFDRMEARSTAHFDPILLQSGRYWLEATIIGPENNFWMVRSTVTGSPFWVDYSDMGGLQPGRNIFNADWDLNFSLVGEELFLTSPPVMEVQMDDCPGTATVSWRDVWPNTPMGLVVGSRIGSTPIPGGPCAGTTLLIAGGVDLVTTLNSGPNGSGQIRGTASAGACGRYLQLVVADGDAQQGIPCSVSNQATITHRRSEFCYYRVHCRTDASDTGGWFCTNAREAVACAGATAWVGIDVVIAQACPPHSDCPTAIRGVLTWSWKNALGITLCRYTARYELRLHPDCGTSPNEMPAEMAAPGACVFACPPW